MRGSRGRAAASAPRPRLDWAVLAEFAGKTVLLGVLDLGDPAVEKLEVVAERIRAGLRWVSGSGWYRL
jgi:5-methyltetrahydropteroyltriglutamate--homocysteine methyltransferase